MATLQIYMNGFHVGSFIKASTGAHVFNIATHD